MNCPYCDHDLSIKDTPQGVYGRCSFCRFSGYIPTGRSEHPSNEDIVRSEYPSRKIEEPSNEDIVRSEYPSRKIEEPSNEDIVRSEYPSPLPCCEKYKTAGGVERHLQKVYEERDIHPGIFRKHKEIFERT